MPILSSAGEAVYTVAVLVVELPGVPLAKQLRVLTECMQHHRFQRPEHRAMTVRLLVVGLAIEEPAPFKLQDFANRFELGIWREFGWSSIRAAIENLTQELVLSP